MKSLLKSWFAGAVAIVGLSLFCVGAQAATLVPHSFTAGTPAKATEVNDNFNALATAIDATAAAVTNITGSNVTFSQGLTVNGTAVIGGDLSVGGQSTVRVVNSAAAPAPASATNAGQLYFDTTTNLLKVSDGTAWKVSSDHKNYGYMSGVTLETMTAAGPIASRVIIFNKLSASSKLKISYTDTFGIYVNTPGPIVTWNVYADGQPVTTPHALRQSLYGGNTGWLIVPGKIDGYVTGIPQGEHTIQIYISILGQLPTAISTGWESSFLLEVEEVD